MTRCRTLARCPSTRCEGFQRQQHCGVTAANARFIVY